MANDPFARFDDYEPSLTRAVWEARQFVVEAQREQGQGPDNPSPFAARWLTISGVCGCGKTLLAELIFRAMTPLNPGNASLWVHSAPEYAERNRRPRAVWMHSDDFAERLRGGDYNLPDYLGRDYLVVIDDIGVTRDPTDYVAGGLYRLANARLGKWTIFTTNLTHSEVSAKIDSRVASRMIRDGNVCVRITAPDFSSRQKGARE